MHRFYVQIGESLLAIERVHGQWKVGESGPKLGRAILSSIGKNGHSELAVESSMDSQRYPSECCRFPSESERML